MNAVVADLLNSPTIEEVEYEYVNLAERYNTISKLSRVGNLVVDYFTLEERLNTGMKGDVCFYDFLRDFDTWKMKKGVNRLYDDSPAKTHIKKVKSVYGMYVGMCHIFKPLQTLNILNTLTCNVAMLDPCAGWGGRLVGASIKNIPRYIGIESNKNLRDPYSRLSNFLQDKSHTQIDMRWCDALDIDYTKLDYDLVLTSPPYFNLEKYNGMRTYRTKHEWKEQFYKPVFTRIFESLRVGGAMALNINTELYVFFVLQFGIESFRIQMDSRGRDNKYTEYVYVWIKR